MSEFRIEIGATNGFRYIGIEPPVSIEQRQDIKNAIDSHYMDTEPMALFHTFKPEQGPPHTLLSISTEGYYTSDAADKDMEQVAFKVARVLGRAATVQVDCGIKQVRLGNHLFNSRSDEVLLTNF